MLLSAFVACKSDENVSVTGVRLDRNAITLTTGAKDTLRASVEPANAYNQSVEWSSSNEAVATVNPANGEVTAITEGETTVTVTTLDGGKTATCAVTVANIHATAISIPDTVVTINSTVVLTPVFTPENTTVKDITWISRKPSVATVSGSGEVLGLSRDTVIIVAIAEGGAVVDSAKVLVTEIKSMSITPESIDMKMGESKSFTIDIQLEDEPSFESFQLKWEFDNEIVSPMMFTWTPPPYQINVYPVKVGSTTITVSRDGFSASCVVNVLPTDATGIAMEQPTLTAYVGNSFTPNVIFTPELTTDKSLTWSSSNTGIATVDANGKVTANSAGSATITARHGDLSADLTLTVIANTGTETTTIESGNGTMATIMVAAGEAIYVDWGDGSSNLYSPNGATPISCAHTYGTRSSYQITIITKAMTHLERRIGGYWTSLDVTQNTQLTYLNADASLTSLDLSNNTKLQDLILPYNPLTSLDLSHCTDLEAVLLQECTSLASLNINGCAKLRSINCTRAKMPSLDFSTCPMITIITCGNNPELTSLQVAGQTFLTTLNGDNCAKLASLNLNGCTALKNAQLSKCDLSSLTVAGCTALEMLICDQNKLTALDLTGLSNLWSLDVSSNLLTATAIDALFGSLNNATLGSAKTVVVRNNSGSATCNETIATGKGWTVQK
jgi:uncharacterized protein YjdB